jgi:membrane associated rhomboid family serine protease
MALGDRSYMREEYHPPEVTTRLIVVLIIAFVIQSILLFYGGFNVNEHLGLSRDGLLHGRVWQLLTFQFLHSAPWPWHVLFNCLGIFFFGRRVEEALGARKFIWIYLLSGILGGLLQVLLTFLPHHPDASVVGASAGVCGLIAVFCSMYPMQEMQTWIYFFPITIRAHWFLKFLLAYSAFGALIPYSNVADGAHLGGCLLGMAYVRWRSSWDDFFERVTVPSTWRRRLTSRNRRRSVNSVLPSSPATDQPSFISKEVDPILDKISAQGLNSLTDEERRILETARKLMR